MIHIGYYLTQNRVKVTSTDWMDVKEELCKTLSDCTYCDPKWVDFKEGTLGGMMMRYFCFAANRLDLPPIADIYPFKPGGQKYIYIWMAGCLDKPPDTKSVAYVKRPWVHYAAFFRFKGQAKMTPSRKAQLTKHYKRLMSFICASAINHDITKVMGQ
jgi:hypothetical protein